MTHILRSFYLYSKCAAELGTINNASKLHRNHKSPNRSVLSSDPTAAAAIKQKKFIDWDIEIGSSVLKDEIEEEKENSGVNVDVDNYQSDESDKAQVDEGQSNNDDSESLNINNSCINAEITGREISGDFDDNKGIPLRDDKTVTKNECCVVQQLCKVDIYKVEKLSEVKSCNAQKLFSNCNDGNDFSASSTPQDAEDSDALMIFLAQ